MADRHQDQIERGTALGGKHHGFADDHEPTRPAQWWFQEAPEGLVLFAVFYTQACRWSQCRGCNLPMLMSRHHVPFAPIMDQVDHLLALPEVAERHDEIHKLIISNNGSVLDQETFSTTALLYLLARANRLLPNLAVVTMETRPEYVELCELEVLGRALAEGACATQLELAIGFEVFDEELRNRVFKKGLDLDRLRALATEMAPYGYRLKCYFMLKPVPEFDDEAAIADVHAAIAWLGGLAAETGLRIDLHLNPTYVARGTGLEDDFRAGRFTPPRLVDAARAALPARAAGVSIFLGLSDEGLAVPGGSFRRPGDEALVAELERFNRTQDFTILEAVVCDRGRG